MDISLSEVLPINPLDAIARDVLGNATIGVSVSDSSRIHLLNESPSDQDTANRILNNFGDLAVNADKTSMTEGDADPIITCADASIASDSEVAYLVWLDGSLYASGTSTVTAGVASLTLVSPVAGDYQIYIYRRTGNYASGSVTISVSEV